MFEIKISTELRQNTQNTKKYKNTFILLHKPTQKSPATQMHKNKNFRSFTQVTELCTNSNFAIELISAWSQTILHPLNSFQSIMMELCTYRFRSF